MQADDLDPDDLTRLARDVLDSPDATLKKLATLAGATPWDTEMQQLLRVRAALKEAAYRALGQVPRGSMRERTSGHDHGYGLGRGAERARTRRLISDAQRLLRRIQGGEAVAEDDLNAVERVLRPVTYKRLTVLQSHESVARIGLSRALREAAEVGQEHFAIALEASDSHDFDLSWAEDGMASRVVIGRLVVPEPVDPGLSIEIAEKRAGGRPDVVIGVEAWNQLADAIIASREGFVFLGGDPAPEAVQRSIRSLQRFAAEAGQGDVLWVESGDGSWWGRFRTAIRSRVRENDLDTLKRAAEVQLLDRHESQSALNYASAVQQLAEAAQGSDHAYLHSKNVLLVKTVLSNGKSVVASRVLTPGEVNAFEAGELGPTLCDSDSAYLFVLTGQRTTPKAFGPN